MVCKRKSGVISKNGITTLGVDGVIGVDEDGR